MSEIELSREERDKMTAYGKQQMEELHQKSIERVAKAIYVAEIGSDAGWDDPRVAKNRHLWLVKASAAIDAYLGRRRK